MNWKVILLIAAAGDLATFASAQAQSSADPVAQAANGAGGKAAGGDLDADSEKLYAALLAIKGKCESQPDAGKICQLFHEGGGGADTHTAPMPLSGQPAAQSHAAAGGDAEDGGSAGTGGTTVDGVAADASSGPVSVPFAASSDTKTATVGVNLDLSKWHYRGASVLNIKATTPFGQDATYQNIANNDGLVKATKIDFTYNWLGGSEPGRGYGDFSNPQCFAVVNKFKSLATATLTPGEQSKLDFVSKICDPLQVQGLLKEYGSEHHDIDLSSVTSDIEKMAQVERGTYPGTWAVSVTAGVGYESHTYYDASTLAVNKVTRTPYEFGLTVTRSVLNGAASLTGGYLFQRKYVDGGRAPDQQVLCQNQASASPKCIYGYIGAPTLQSAHLVDGEFRWIFPVHVAKWTIPLGIDPEFTYDVASKVYGFQIPIYLMPSSSKFLTGGLRVDWKSDTRTAVFGIFVSSPFCILPGDTGCGSMGK